VGKGSLLAFKKEEKENQEEQEIESADIYISLKFIDVSLYTKRESYPIDFKSEG
jgi:hypothetical protein